MINPVLKSTKIVIETSKFVKINKENLLNFCSNFELKEVPFWLENAPFLLPKLNENEELAFMFISSSLVFCFWGEPKWTVEYKGKFYDGSWGLLASLTRAIKNGFPILNFNYLAKIPEKDLREILKGNVEIPLFKERLNILRENASILIKKFDGSVKKLIQSGKGDALKLLNIIVKNFPSFNDFGIYEGKKVYFHKRAQVFISDVHRKFKDKKFGKLKNIDKLTALADYKIPQVLRKFGIIEYSPELSEKVDNRIEIPKGSKEEIEIRANTIWAIELMKREIKKKIPEITAREIDSYLWFLSQKKSPNDKPYHLTKTIFY